MQLRRANHARQPPQKPKVKETVVQLQAARSSQSGGAETIRAPLSLRREHLLPSVTDKCRRGKRGDNSRYAYLSCIASVKRQELAIVRSRWRHRARKLAANPGKRAHAASS